MEYVCGVYGCGTLYEAVQGDSTPCPCCGFSETNIRERGTNIPELLSSEEKNSEVNS
jgi:hypothetical protein